MEELLKNKFCCVICYELKVLIGTLGCKCRKYFCGDCFMRISSKDNCPCCMMNTDLKLLQPLTEDSMLLEYTLNFHGIPSELCPNQCGFESRKTIEMFQHLETCVKVIECPLNCDKICNTRWYDTLTPTEIMSKIHMFDVCSNEVCLDKCHLCDKKADTINHVAYCLCRNFEFCKNTPIAKIKAHIKICIDIKKFKCRVCHSLKKKDITLDFENIKEHYQKHHPVDYRVIEYIASKCTNKYRNFMKDILIHELPTKDVMNKYKSLI